MAEVTDQRPIQASVLERERAIWAHSAFTKYIPDTSSPQFDMIEERMVYIGPHRIMTSFYVVKPDEAASMMRRASVAILENTIEREKSDRNEKGKEANSVQDSDSTASLKEALIKNPSVIQLLNPQGKTGSPNQSLVKLRTVVFAFKDNSEENVFFKLPSMTAISKIDSSTQLMCNVSRQVNGTAVEGSVTIIIKDASDRLHDLVLESARDPTRLCVGLSKVGTVEMVYKECAVSFVPPAGLDEDNFWPTEIAEAAAPPKSKKPKTAKPAKPVAKKEEEQTEQASALAMKQCAHCGSKGTPQWRRGPDGAGTLCNACGVKWKHGKLSISRKVNEEIDVVKDEHALTDKPAPVKESFIPLKKRKFLQSSYSSRVSSTDEIQAVEAKDAKDKPDPIAETTEP